jgi:hypothetical protein
MFVPGMFLSLGFRAALRWASPSCPSPSPPAVGVRSAWGAQQYFAANACEARGAISDIRDPNARSARSAHQYSRAHARDARGALSDIYGTCARIARHAQQHSRPKRAKRAERSSIFMAHAREARGAFSDIYDTERVKRAETVMNIRDGRERSEMER